MAAQADETDDPDAAYGIRSAWKVVDRVIAERLPNTDGDKQSGDVDKKSKKAGKKDGQQKEDAATKNGGTASILRQREFLVKWRELQYDACTWESEADLAAWGADADISRFRLLEPIQKSAQARKVCRLCSRPEFSWQPSLPAGATRQLAYPACKLP